MRLWIGIVHERPLLITTTPGPVAALAWNTAIQNLFDTVFSWSGSKLAGQLVYPL